LLSTGKQEETHFWKCMSKKCKSQRYKLSILGKDIKAEVLKCKEEVRKERKFEGKEGGRRKKREERGKMMDRESPSL
jgi:hypothetical protein